MKTFFKKHFSILTFLGLGLPVLLNNDTSTNYQIFKYGITVIWFGLSLFIEYLNFKDRKVDDNEINS